MMIVNSHHVPRLYSFMLNLAMHEILNAPLNTKISRISAFSSSDKPKILFFLLKNV